MPTSEEKLQQRRREDARRDVLSWLAMRAPLAFRCAAIRQGIKRHAGIDYSEEEIISALAFRRGMTPPEIEEVRDRAGTDHHYRITTDGQLHYERDEY